MLIDQGFGIRGPVHVVEMPCKGGVRKGLSEIWLFPGMADRIIQLDESSVGGNSLYDDDDEFLVPEGVQPSGVKNKDSSIHTTGVGCLHGADYTRPELNHNGVHIPAVAQQNGRGMIKQVCVVASWLFLACSRWSGVMAVDIVVVIVVVIIVVVVAAPSPSLFTLPYCLVYPAVRTADYFQGFGGQAANGDVEATPEDCGRVPQGHHLCVHRDRIGVPAYGRPVARGGGGLVRPWRRGGRAAQTVAGEE